MAILIQKNTFTQILWLFFKNYYNKKLLFEHSIMIFTTKNGEAKSF